jgi:hypothetical protein
MAARDAGLTAIIPISGLKAVLSGSIAVFRLSGKEVVFFAR